MAARKKKYFALILYLILFYAAWAFVELFVARQINLALVLALAKSVLKILIWIIPAIFLINMFREDVFITLKEMFAAKVDWLRYLPVYSLLVVWVLLGALRYKLNFDFTPDEMIIVLFVGITEEMVFRGWLLNAMVKDMPKWLAIAINALLFLFIHFPSWIREGTMVGAFLSLNFIGLTALSVIFSISFLKSKNILIPITMHMLYDGMMFAFLP